MFDLVRSKHLLLLVLDDRHQLSRLRGGLLQDLARQVNGWAGQQWQIQSSRVSINASQKRGPKR